MFSMGEPDMPPLVFHYGVIDQATAIMASHAILTSLIMRERDGKGQEVHVSILGSALFLAYSNFMHSLFMNSEAPRHRRSRTDPLRNYYPCKGGGWFSFSLPPHWDPWRKFCQAIGNPELGKDPRFDSQESRTENCEELIAILDGVFATRTSKEWHRIFGEHDLISSPVNTTLDLKDDTQIVENRYIVDFEDPSLGSIKLPGYPVHFSQARAGTTKLAPALGEHTEQILKELGYNEEQIKGLRAEGVC